MSALSMAQPDLPTPQVDLVAEQQRTLASPRRRYGFLARLLFFTMDLVYGRARTLSKFKVLELIARVPYQTWEHVAYVAVTHLHRKPHFARRVFEFVRESRAQQDNEQWHLLILEEAVQRRGIEEGFLRYRVVPQLIAFFYYHVSWLLYVINPRLSYALNADFEDHAEHEYMHFVQENPDLENQPFVSDFRQDYGSFRSMAELLRRIGLDEREHKDESLARMAQPRFT
jgi:ubiquinol oxidase